MRSLTIVRLHLEGNTAENAPLKVLPSSHRTTETILNAKGKHLVCLVKHGSALAMKPPLLKHAFAKSRGGQRRVIHFLFGPQQSSDGAEWHQAI
ncbi:MAG: hypothetical protein AAFY72_13175 [Cyanobacteria bacterium J06649_4]